MITEAEAKTKWCPLARTLVTSEMKEQRVTETRFNISSTSANRFPDDLFPLCIGSACMAWRVTDAGFEIHSDNGRDVTRAQPPEGEGWERDRRDMFWHRRVREPRGYCGAFGRPE